MKGKLVKRLNRWDLYGEDDSKIASSLDWFQKLSIKNCQAIERGYDLEELAVNYANAELSKEFTSKVGNFYGFSSSYIEGFKKALELLEDKKFSEKDLLKSLHKLADSFIRGYPYHQDLDFQEGNQIIQSLQQPTEIEVEIEMECLDPNCDGIDKKGVCIPGDKPKLDSEGCLILKKI
jgi:hypothetical protein